MRNLFLVRDDLANKISYYHLATFLMALPFDFFYSQIILISFGIHTLIHSKKENWKNIISKSFWVPVSIYILGLLAIVYSPDKQEGVSIIGRQIAILIFPLLFVLTDLDIAKYRDSLLCIFGFTCTIAILYLYTDALRTIIYFHLPASSLFTLQFMNHNFSMPIAIHATYLSIYTAFSLLILLYFIFKKPELKQNWLYIICILILSAGLIQLSSRAVFIAFLLVINGVFPFFIFKGNKRKIFLVAASVISLTAIMFIYTVDSFKTRYVSELRTDLSKNAKLIENTEPRLARWNAITELIKKSPIIGHGTGSEKKLLKEKYFEKGLYISYLNEFNTHSEYLSITIKMGVIGLLLFMYILYFGFASALREGNVLFLSFVIIIAVVSISENILDLNKGIFFYSFFFPFFCGKEKRRADFNKMAKQPQVFNIRLRKGKQ